jgi:hypothetical protein
MKSRVGRIKIRKLDKAFTRNKMNRDDEPNIRPDNPTFLNIRQSWALPLQVAIFCYSLLSEYRKN